MKINRSICQHGALVVLLVTVVYYPSIFARFNSLDDLKMVSHLLNHDGFNLREVFLPHITGTYYRPLLYLTFIADKYLWGAEASFMHLENILLHTGNSLLVFFLVRQLLACMSIQFSFAPLVAALFFGLHPIATEPVNWVSGRTDLLGGFFVLAALWFFLRSLQSLSVRYALFGSLLLFTGCLSKETALFLVPVLLLWSLLPPKDSSPEPSRLFRLKISVLTIVPAALYLPLRWLALSGGDRIVKSVNKAAAVQNESSLAVFDIFRVVAESAGFYFKKLIMPLPLNFGINTISPHYFWLGLLVFAGIAWCLYCRDTVSYLFITAFMLTSSAFVLPLLKITWTAIAERYVYIAAAPFIIGVTLLFLKYVNKAVSLRLTTLFVAILLGGATVVTAQRNIIWQDNYTLYKDTMEKSPGFTAVVNEYAVALRERGQFAEADKIMLANQVDEFQPSSLNNIRVLTMNGQLAEAHTLLLQRIEKGSEYPYIMFELLLTINELRRAKASSGKEQLAINNEILGTYQKLFVLTGDPFYHYKIGKLHLELKNKNEAKSSFKKAWEGAPPKSHYREAARKLAENL